MSHYINLQSEGIWKDSLPKIILLLLESYLNNIDCNSLKEETMCHQALWQYLNE